MNASSLSEERFVAATVTSQAVHRYDRSAISQRAILIENSSNADVILIVEDEPLIMMDAVDILYSAGFRTVQATSALEAIAILDSRDDVAAVFTDIQIVGEPDGLRLAHMVRERWPPMGLVVTSGRVSPTEAEIPAGGSFIAKPYTPKALVRCLRAVLH